MVLYSNGITRILERWNRLSFAFLIVVESPNTYERNDESHAEKLLMTVN